MAKSEKEIIDEIISQKQESQSKAQEGKKQVGTISATRQYFKGLMVSGLSWIKEQVFDVNVKNFPKKYTIKNFPKSQKVEGEVEIKDLKSVIVAINRLEEKVEQIDTDVEFPEVQMVKGKVDTDVKIPKYPDFPKTIKINNLKRVVEGLESVKKAIKKSQPDFPEINIPEPPDKVEVKNLPEFSKYFDELKRAVMSLDREIDIPSNEPVITAVQKVQKAIEGLRFPEYNMPASAYVKDGSKTSVVLTENGEVPVDIDEDQAIRVDDYTTANVQYVGKADPGTATSEASWQVMKVDETTGTVITWADGDTEYDNIWDDRATLSYS